MQQSRCHRPFPVRIQNHQIRVGAGCNDAFFRIQSGHPGRISAGVFHQLRQGDSSLHDTLGVKQDQPFLHARSAAGTFGEILCTLLLLFCKGKRTVIRRHRVQFAFRQGRPQCVPVFLPPQRRRHDRFQSFPWVFIHLLIQQQVLRAGFRAEMRLPGGSGFPDFLQSLPGGKMYDINRRVTGRLCQIQQPVHRFRLGLCRPADGVPARLGLTLLNEFFSEKGYDPVVFAMYGDQDPFLRGALQHLHQVQVVQPAIIGHIGLEARDSFLFGNLRHVLQHVVVHMLQHAVEAVIHRGVSVRKAVILPYLMPWAASCRSKGHMVHNRGGSAAGRRRGACIEIVDDPGDPHVQVHVRMDIHRAGQDIFACRINGLGHGRR